MATTVLIVLEGVRPDALIESSCKNYTALRQGGSYTNQARTVFPSLSLPCHMSLVHSIPPIEHMVTDDQSISSHSLSTGFFDYLDRHGLKTGSFYSNPSLRCLSRSESHSFNCYRNKEEFDGDGDIDLASRAISWINSENPDFAFINLAQADDAGHQSGWMSQHYMNEVENLDRILGFIVNGLPLDAHLFVVANHGGHGFDHGTKLPEDLQIPWVACGPKIRSNYQISRQVTIMDTIPSIASIMGVDPHGGWKGSVISEIFQSTHIPRKARCVSTQAVGV